MSLDRGGHDISAAIEPVLTHFSAITDIPRPSRGEDVIRSYLIAKAQELGLSTKVDQTGNLAIDVPASQGCESWQRIIMQGHMDMVTTGGNDVNPTQVYIDKDGWMKAKNTTLGADNGMALAIILALLEDKSLRHGPMTVLFTVNEESEAEPMGVESLDPELIPQSDAAILINLDSEEGANLICRGCAASSDITAEFAIGGKETLPDNYQTLDIDLSGLLSGHSGDDIHLKRGNALKLLNSFLIELKESGIDFKMIEYSGGERTNVIPKEAQTKIAVPQDKIDFVSSSATAFVKAIKGNGHNHHLAPEWAQNLTLTVNTAAESAKVMAISDEVRDRLLFVIENFVNGPLESVAGEWRDGVKLSNNVALMEQTDDVFRLFSLARGLEREKLERKVAAIKAFLFESGAKSVDSTQAVGDWLEPEDSRAIKLALQAGKAVLPHAPYTMIYHVSLECSIVREKLRERIKDLAAVSLGPVVRGGHTIEERVQVSSIEPVLKLVREMIGRAGKLE